MSVKKVIDTIGEHLKIEEHETDRSKLIVSMSPEAELAYRIVRKHCGNRKESADKDTPRP